MIPRPPGDGGFLFQIPRGTPGRGILKLRIPRGPRGGGFFKATGDGISIGGLVSQFLKVKLALFYINFQTE